MRKMRDAGASVEDGMVKDILRRWGNEVFECE